MTDLEARTKESFCEGFEDGRRAAGMKNELSPTMKVAVAFAREHGGKLYRYPGGFWAGPKFERWGTSFGTPTVEALVKREVAEYTEWKQGRNVRFPVEATLTESTGE